MKFRAFALLPAVMIAANVWAADPELCMDCHEPSEDWEGMSSEDILAEAKDPGIKRHADNLELSDEDLKSMITELTKK